MLDAITSSEHLDRSNENDMVKCFTFEVPDYIKTDNFLRFMTQRDVPALTHRQLVTSLKYLNIALFVYWRHPSTTWNKCGNECRHPVTMSSETITVTKWWRGTYVTW